MTQYLENKVLDGTLGNTTYTAPANVYMALYSTNNTKTTPGTEITGNGYSRQLVTFNTAADGAITANGAVTFSCTGNAWPVVVNAAILDASTAGNMLYFGTISPKTVVPDASLTFDDGNVIITIT